MQLFSGKGAFSSTTLDFLIFLLSINFQGTPWDRYIINIIHVPSFDTKFKLNKNLLQSVNSYYMQQLTGCKNLTVQLTTV